MFGLQETFLTSSKTPSFSGFNILTKNSLNDRAAALFINKSYLFSEVHLNTPLQAVAARVTLNKVITFCSIYLPLSDHIAKTDPINLVKQLPSLFVLLGDFNGHYPVWGNESYNNRGQMSEDLFSEMDLCILNDESTTYIHPATGSTSALDLSICGLFLVLDYECNIHEDLCGSDHFPVILTCNGVKEEAAPNRWNFKKADWLPSKFSVPLNWRKRQSCLPRIPLVSLLTYLLKQQTKLYQKHTSRKNFPKFHGLMIVVKEQLKKERKLSESSFLTQRWVMFKILRAKARHVKQQKRNSWRHFCNKLNSKTQTQKVWKAIRKIKGKGGCNSVNHLKVNGNLITDKKEVAEILAKNMSKNSMTDNSSDGFQRIKTFKKKKKDA